jgi:hypothetical protein
MLGGRNVSSGGKKRKISYPNIARRGAAVREDTAIREDKGSVRTVRF